MLKILKIKFNFLLLIDLERLIQYKIKIIKNYVYIPIVIKNEEENDSNKMIQQNDLKIEHLALLI